MGAAPRDSGVPASVAPALALVVLVVTVGQRGGVYRRRKGREELVALVSCFRSPLHVGNTTRPIFAGCPVPYQHKKLL
jgi:hypothetical protein